jgi:hypothetical protein
MFDISYCHNLKEGLKKMQKYDFTLASMIMIRKTKKFDVVSAKQIDALAKFIESKQGKNEKIDWVKIVQVVENAK